MKPKDLYDLFREEPSYLIDGAWVWRLDIHLIFALFHWKVTWVSPNQGSFW